MSYTNETPRNYEQASALLGSRQSKLIGLNTRIQRHENGDIGVTLHSTEVARWDSNGMLEVSTGGWNTVTTRERLNRYLPRGVNVFTKRGVLYIGNGESEKLFVDGGKVTPTGELVGFQDANGSARGTEKLRRQVKTFAKSYIEAMKTGKIPAPSSGDCWYCAMRVQSPVEDQGKTLGEASKDSSHIVEHMKENYFVPSLLVRATEQFGASPVANQCIASQWAGNTTDEIREEARTAYFYGIGWQQLEKTLRRYVMRQFGVDAR